MPRKIISPWKTGDLFSQRSESGTAGSPGAEGAGSPPAAAAEVQPARTVLTVSQLTGTIKRVLERELGSVWVTGEVTNLRMQPSGHWYFTLKDESAQLSCVLFRGEAARTRQYVQDGQKLLLQGVLTVYEPRGQYQLRVSQVELQGVGALQLAFEQLKRRLQAEGLFATERKRAIPRYPRRVGIVTSASGAALQDVLHVVRRRHPGLELVLAHCRVQGQGAADEIASAIGWLNHAHASGLASMDLILVTRGGGSLEDLWAFNEEVVARAIFASALPVISAVGHEIDMSISDMVADLRAATPTAAAELMTEGAFSSRQFLADASERLHRAMHRRLVDAEEDLQMWMGRLQRMSPRRHLEDQEQYLDDLFLRLRRSVRRRYREHQTASTQAVQRLLRLRPSQWLRLRQDKHVDLERRLKEVMARSFSDRKPHLASLLDRLRILSPLHVLERGYSLTTDETSGHIIRSVADVQQGQKIKTQVKDGSWSSEVSSIPLKQERK